MPIYLCRPGCNSKEPWRHGVRVYDRPHKIDNDDGNVNESTANDKSSWSQQSRHHFAFSSTRSISESSNDNSLSIPRKISSHSITGPAPVRRVRHAEVVLVDAAVVSHGRYWLRLRWPGELGGFGGYMSLGKVESATAGEIDDNPDRGISPHSDSEDAGGRVNTVSSPVFCQETNIFYPTAETMKLLTLYDDGLGVEEVDFGGGGGGSLMIDETIAVSLDSGEPVFCRICREGLHDVNYDLEVATSAAGAADDTSPNPTHRRAQRRKSRDEDSSDHSDATGGGGEGVTMSELSDEMTSTPSGVNGSTITSERIRHHPPLVLHHPTAENPLLAPCACTGTMAFVHYLCIEQWRCRSRHPGARNGLNCETCGAEYTLPPPPSRPLSSSQGDVFNNGNAMVEEDWLDAMPPHVLAALRRPHPWWQIGAAVVRRRWLRPFVPIIVSPLVALYCRSRRTLKKRGVSRRRWACSLCRRRARWKCVRCLRSYYCSRQCQNVSWHIVHKHVCYKPARFWWSVVVYTAVVLIAIPGILKDMLLYDMMIILIPINFTVMGVIAGGFASALKLYQGSDIRGRMLEMVVVFFTIWLTIISSGLVRGYFGEASSCAGFVPILGSIPTGPFASVNEFLKYVLHLCQSWYQEWDYLFAKFGFLSTSVFCAAGPDGRTDFAKIGCSPSVRTINPEFYTGEEGRQCRADLVLVLGVWLCSVLFLFIGSLDRFRGARQLAAHRGRGRHHQD